ncbi:PTS system fructose-specific IIABC component [Spiroplasma sabaudiense Ar-1343]|uniref:PTS system fructose-specific IIABC component n=1 Tax=Spiroplasma sabaudiense Ar-1343 TaxID=1276257 RepID=W6AII3_9MOLU|nr:fructose-specific PTS transporter subunit EIIC [Spiroplasma sabaudiense]AHI53514.1 PTS system fructose-specific IIABC component [Spiroplasma sabaudiense Ar-1343]
MTDDIFKSELIFLDQQLNSKAEVFDFIAEVSLKNQLTNNKQALISGFENREQEGSTGFEDGFAIPHARIAEVKQAAVFIIRLKNGVDWNSLDGKPTNVVIALLVPDGPSGDEHLSILSSIATKLLNEDFKSKMNLAKSKKQILELLRAKEDQSSAIKELQSENQNAKLKVVAITACITGIAHTYLAEEKLLQELPKHGYSIRVETQGSKGVGTPLKESEIKEADLVIFATDTNVDKSRFIGKKCYQTKVAKAMKDPLGTVKNAIDLGTIIEGKTNFQTKSSKDREGVMSHIMAGISYMIPVIVLGGICLAFSIGIAKAIWGPTAGTDGPNGEYKWGILNTMSLVGGAAFAMMIPILAGFIGNSISGRAAIAPAMVGAFLGNNPANFMPLPGMDVVATPAGFLGAIAAGLMAGYAVKWINTWRVPRTLQAAMPIFFIPIVVGLGIGLLFIYVIGGPIGWLMDQISKGFSQAYKSKLGVFAGLGLGMALGAMAGFDMGGPVNKIAFVTGSALITAGIYEPMGAVAAAIPVAPLGMGITTLVVPKFFDKDTKNLGIAAIIMGCIGISEGAIPFAIRDPKRAVVSNVLGSAVAGGIAGALMVTNAAAHGGPIVAILGAVPYGLQTLFFFIAIIAGVATTTLVYSSWLLYDAGKPGSVKEAHVERLYQLNQNCKSEINDLKEQIFIKKSVSKKQIREAKLSNQDFNKIKTATNSEIQEIQEKIKQTKNDYNLQKEKAKIAFNLIKKDEATFLKTKVSEVKEFFGKAGFEKKEKLKSLKDDLTKKEASANKLEVKNLKTEFLNQKQELDSDYKEQIKNYQINIHKKFVDQYKQIV